MDARLRYGELVDNALELEPHTRLLVLGQHGRAHPTGKVHLDHHVEQVIRATSRPVLVTTSTPLETPCRLPSRSTAAPPRARWWTEVAASPLLQGLPLVLLSAGAAVSSGQQQTRRGPTCTHRRWLSTTVESLAGEPEEAIAAYLKMAMLPCWSWGLRPLADSPAHSGQQSPVPYCA